ncbi:MAG: DUF1272 domain-containing protein [Arenibacterium sp.]
MLELRPNCEICDLDLPPASSEARICSYECTYCATCAEGVLRGVCPNCGGNLVPRPVRPAKSWRKGTGLAHHPASDKRRTNRYSEAEHKELSNKLAAVDPTNR